MLVRINKQDFQIFAYTVYSLFNPARAGNPAMKFAEDYAVFAISLLIPIAVGFYFACQGGRQKTTTEFLLADKNQRSWLIALSLVASYFSSVLLLGTTAEVFTYGVQYIIFALFSYWIVAAIAHVIFIPMFHRVKITSVNEVSCFFPQFVASKIFCLDLITNNAPLVLVLGSWKIH